MESQLDAENIEKILEAAQQIERMAKSRPDQAKQMLEQAHHLIELAEQIKRDWLNRFATLPRYGRRCSGPRRGENACCRRRDNRAQRRGPPERVLSDDCRLTSLSSRSHRERQRSLDLRR